MGASDSPSSASMDAPPSTRFGTLGPVLLSFIGLPLALFWNASWGRTEPTLLVAIGLALTLLASLAGLALRRPCSFKRALTCCLLLVAEFPLAASAIWVGRAYFRYSLIRHLDEYRPIAELGVTRARSARREVTIRDPHPDFALVQAVETSDGGAVVRLAFRHAPRQNIYYLSRSTLPANKGKACLERLEGPWYWYSRC